MNDTETQSQLRLAPIAALLCALAVAPLVRAQGNPYFVVYDHHMEEPGNLEVALTSASASPKEGPRTLATNFEFEYGTTGWWTSALYLDGVSTTDESTRFTGYRIENRFRLLMREHVVNPVFYIEYADTNGADRIAKEIVGFDSWHDFTEPIGEAAEEKERELETKLILSSNRRGWNFSANAIGEKNLAGGPWEFGYAIGTNRPLALAAQPRQCLFCRENFVAGVELYGGAGEQHERTFAHTAHYIAPTVAWSLPNGITLRVSPGWGLTDVSNRSFVRFGISFEGHIR